mmetsp:Transcript_58937/g.156894  ORF Transcript_58937/g.156894 Transcript_58937/m.156894 type:complete len:373 (-) Transcript_58937:240-1358(-)
MSSSNASPEPQRTAHLPGFSSRASRRSDQPAFARQSIGRSTTPVERDDFEVLELLGTGGYSEVKLVHCKRDGGRYAMKAVEKAMLRERRHVGDDRAAERAKVERDLGVAARQWDCRFICELFAAFQTKSKLYYVFEYCPGGELLDLLSAQPESRFQEPMAQFYTVELTLALTHLHDHDCIHRDVRLENVLIALDGHVKLTDFNYAKSGLTQGVTGSFMASDSPLVFMPPECRRGDVHGKEVDCWQLGVAVFAMMMGSFPDIGQPWPNPMRPDLSAQTCAFCADLLQEDHTQRLGHPNGGSCIQAHAFFLDTKWDEFVAGTATPPYRPRCKDSPDNQHGPRPRRTMCSGVSDVLSLDDFSFNAERFDSGHPVE